MLFGKLRKILLIIVVIALIAFSIKGEKIFPKKVILPNSFFSFHNFRASSEPDGYINIYGSHTVGQEAVMNFPSLCRLGFLIRKDKITDKNLILHVRRSIQDKKDMLVLRAKKSDLFDNYYPFLLPEIITGPRTSVFYFQFKPLTYPDKNKIYFWLESPDSTAEDGIKIAYYKNKYWRGLFAYLIYKKIFFPDVFLLWMRPAIREAKKIIKKQKHIISILRTRCRRVSVVNKNRCAGCGD